VSEAATNIGALDAVEIGKPCSRVLSHAANSELMQMKLVFVLSS